MTEKSYAMDEGRENVDRVVFIAGEDIEKAYQEFRHRELLFMGDNGRICCIDSFEMENKNENREKESCQHDYKPGIVAQHIRTSYGGLQRLEGFCARIFRNEFCKQNHLPNRLLCVPVRERVNTNISSSMRYTNNQSGRIWHSRCPTQFPDKAWSLFFSGKMSPMARVVITDSKSSIFSPCLVASL